MKHILLVSILLILCAGTLMAIADFSESSSFIFAMGSLNGTVTTGVDNAPLEGIMVQIPGYNYAATTDAAGEYQIQHMLPATYNVLFSKNGYISQTLELELQGDQEAVMNVTMQPMSTVSVSGTIMASDTGNGLAGAVVSLWGYANYAENTTASGGFSFATVYANESYEYVITCPGYTVATGSISVGATAYQMDTIILNEIAYAPHSVLATLNATYTAVDLQWEAPDPNATEIIESFEEDIFPPQDWTQSITNTGAQSITGVYPTFKRLGMVEIAGDTNAIPTSGSFQTGLRWDYDHQDEWLFTPSFNCPLEAYLSFDSYVFLGSTQGDHYYVKISADDSDSWHVLWDASAETGGQTYYDAPFVIDLAAYVGQNVTLAFQAVDPVANDGLRFSWFIDNVYIGNANTPFRFDVPAPVHHGLAFEPNPPVAKAFSHEGRALRAQQASFAPRSITRYSRGLTGYEVYRLYAGQETNESSWTLLTDELISALVFEDEEWDTLPNGIYRYGVKAAYTAELRSPAALSAPLTKENFTGNIVGIVRRANGQGISGAKVVTGTHEATTNAAGAYSLGLSVGSYSVSASAAGYKAVTVDNVVVSPNQTTTLNITLEASAGEDELSPVAATALKGNSPNPFNPTTTIYYDILEPCKVRLDIYNVKGQKVKKLLDEVKNSGRHSIVFEARDENGKALSSGIYFYRFTTDRYNATRKMLLME